MIIRYLTMKDNHVLRCMARGILSNSLGRPPTVSQIDRLTETLSHADDATLESFLSKD